MVMKVETDILGLEGGSAQMNCYFAPAVTAEDDTAAGLACTRVKDALTELVGELNTSITYRVSPAVTVYDEATGAVVRVATGTPYSVVGTNGGVLLPSATSLVAIWETGAAGPRRLIRGRTNISGIVIGGAGDGGVPSSSMLTLGQAFADGMNDAGTTDLVFGVWTRPVAGAGGAFHGCSAQRVSPRWGVLRSRRD